jgi:hypothetical protein
MEIDCLQRNSTFKFKITLDRHNARLKLIYCFLPDPLHFSLPSTFEKIGFETGSGSRTDSYPRIKCIKLRIHGLLGRGAALPVEADEGPEEGKVTVLPVHLEAKTGEQIRN